jgi:6,7-dimethyl-8-ribityllumazine synthase
MATETRPELDAHGQRFCVVAARFNETYVRRLVDAALAVLRQRGAADDALEVIWVPGSFELPIGARWAARSGRYDAVLAFGVLIQGQTEHFRLVAEAASQGLMKVALESDVPVLHGLLAVHATEHAAARSGEEHNRGAEVALAAVQMAQLARGMRSR